MTSKIDDNNIPYFSEEITDEIIRQRAKEALKGSQKSTKVGEGLLKMGGLALGGVLLHSLLSQPSQRFSAKEISTARGIGEAVRARRKDLGYSQAKLAQLAGTGERFVLEVERGKETAEIGKVFDLLSALGLETRLTVKG